MENDQQTVFHAIIKNSNGLTVADETFTSAEDARAFVEILLTEKYNETLAEWSEGDAREPQNWDNESPNTWLADDGNWYVETGGENPRTAVVDASGPHSSFHEALRTTGNIDLLDPIDQIGDGVLRLDLTAEQYDVLEEVVQYRVGPNLDFFGREGGQTVFKGLDVDDITPLMSGCHELQKEYAAGGFYDMAKAADRVESKLGRFYLPGVTN